MTKPITPEEMKAWIDKTWEKCQSEAWKEPRQWVRLTDEEIMSLLPVDGNRPATTFARAIEAKLKEKNHE